MAALLREPASAAVDSKTRRRLREIAHHLSPVIIIGEAGLSPGVVAETNRALDDHELIKVRINAEDRDERRRLGVALAGECSAETIQTIGKTFVLYRHNAQARPELSNVLRAGARGA